MRAVLLICLVALSACRAPYMSDIADLTTFPDNMPPPGTQEADLVQWFDANGYAPGPRVFEAEADLRRLPGAALAYVLDEDRSWWLSRTRIVRDFCFTHKTIYYKLDGKQALFRAILTNRSQC